VHFYNHWNAWTVPYQENIGYVLVDSHDVNGSCGVCRFLCPTWKQGGSQPLLMETHLLLTVLGSDCGLFLTMKHSLRFVDCCLFQKSVEHTVATFAPARWLKLVLNRCQRSSWQDFWVLCLSSGLVIFFTMTPDIPERLMGTGIWHIEFMSRRLGRGIIWQSVWISGRSKCHITTCVGWLWKHPSE